jgi:antitoxin VapB
VQTKRFKSVTFLAPVALSIRDRETERLAAEVAALTGDSKTGAVRQALRRQRERVRREAGRRGQAWLLIPVSEFDRPLPRGD